MTEIMPEYPGYLSHPEPPVAAVDAAMTYLIERLGDAEEELRLTRGDLVRAQVDAAELAGAAPTVSAAEHDGWRSRYYHDLAVIEQRLSALTFEPATPRDYEKGAGEVAGLVMSTIHEMTRAAEAPSEAPE